MVVSECFSRCSSISIHPRDQPLRLGSLSEEQEGSLRVPPRPLLAFGSKMLTLTARRSRWRRSHTERLIFMFPG
jgi:hypothetical protein